MSVRSKISLLALCIILVLVTLVSLALLGSFRSMLRDKIFEQQYQLVSELADQLNGRLTMAQTQLYLTAARVNSSNLHDKQKLVQLLDDKEDVKFVFDTGLLIIDASGVVLAENIEQPELVGTSLSSQEYVSETLRTGKPYLSSPFKSSEPSQTPQIALTQPIRDDSDHVIALIVGYHTLGTGNFLTSLTNNNTKAGYRYLLNDRTIVEHPDKARIMEVVPSGKNVGIDKAITGFEGSLDNLNSKGQRMLSSFKRVGDSRLVLGANTPYSVAFGQLNTLNYLTAAVALCGVFLAAILIWLFARYVTKPIKELTAHVDKGGEWQPVTLNTGDEIELLARTFNRMMNDVQDTKHLLKDEKEFFSGIIQNAAAPMFVIDRHHKILFWNNALAKMTGKSSFQMVNTKQQWSPFYPTKRPVLADLVVDHSPERLDEFYETHSLSLLKEGSLKAEGWYENLGGKRRYIFFEAAPVKNSANEVIAAIETLEDITDRKLAQEEMDRQNEFLQVIMDAIPSPVYYKNTLGKYIGCNKAFLTFFGLGSTSEILGRTISDILPAEYTAQSALMDSTVLNERNLHNYETILPRFDGMPRNVLVTKAPFANFDGSMGGIVGTFVDVTEQLKIDEQVRTMSRALEQSPATIVITDLKGRIEYVNPKFCLTTGYSCDEAIGSNPRVLKSGEQSDELYRALWHTVSNGDEWRGELHNKRKDGTLYWEYASISPLLDKQGNITGYLAVKEDITARKEVEAELERNRCELEAKHNQLEELFEMVAQGKREWEETLDHLQDFVILADADHHIRRCNKMMTETTGRTIHELAGTDWRDVLTEAGFDFTNFDGISGESNQVSTGRTYDVAVYQMKGNAGVTGHVVSLNDTTELRLANQELEKAYAGLKEAQLQIFQQEKMASIGQLAAGVAHEINNPMGFISSNLNTLNKYVERLAEYISVVDQNISAGSDSDYAGRVQEVRKRLKIDRIMGDSHELIAESLDGAGRVRRIVQDLKSFSRVDQAESALIDMNGALETTINIAWNEIKYVAELHRDFGEVPPIKCFPQQLNQVFLNLLVNAAHAMEGGQGAITVSTRSDGTSLFVAVADNGKGIAEENLQRIFEPFFTTKEVGKGTGLGLSISYDIIKKHGGEIMVESQVGVGTTFTVRLPIDGSLA
jgi:two-component system NtrC family sensor kinase